MSRNGSGTYSFPNPTFTSGTAISSAAVNANQADIATEMTNSLPRDGQAAPTANIPMGNFKFTGLGAGSASTDSATLGQTQASAYIWASTAGGTGDAITLTPAPAITAYAAGQTFRFIASAANTTAVTVNVSAVGNKAIKKTVSGAAAALASGDLVEGGVYQITYDGTQFRLFDIHLLDLQVTTAKINDLAVTEGKIAGSAVTSDKLKSTGVALPNGSTATTQTAADNSTKIATTAYFDSVINGAWVTSFTPTISADSGSFTSASATMAYKVVGDIVFFQAEVTITTAGTAIGVARITLPYNPNGFSIGVGRETASTGTMLQVFKASATTLGILKYDNNTAIADGRVLTISGWYRK